LRKLGGVLNPKVPNANAVCGAAIGGIMESRITKEIFEISDEEKASLVARRKQALQDQPVSLAELTPEKIRVMKPAEHTAMMEKILRGHITD
jgi:hypothetical protein